MFLDQMLPQRLQIFEDTTAFNAHVILDTNMFRQVEFDVGRSQESLLAVGTLVRVDTLVPGHVICQTLSARHAFLADIAREKLGRRRLGHHL